MVIYNPLAGGIFSGKYKSADEIPSEGRFAGSDMGARYRERFFKDSVFQALSIVESAASKHKLTLIETALRWVHHHSDLNMKGGGRDGIIIGVSSLAQLEQNLTDCEKGPLPEEVVQALDKAWHIAKPDAAGYYRGELKYGYDTVRTLFSPVAKQ